MSHPLLNFLENKNIHELIKDTTNSDENFLKEFSIGFYQIIIDTDDFSIFEDILIEWINSINNDKDTESTFGLMQNHEQTKFWFSSIIGFFYQYGISCVADKSK